MSSRTGQEQAFFSSLTVYELFLYMILRTGQEHEFLNCSRTFFKHILGTNCSYNLSHLTFLKLSLKCS